MTGQMTYWQIMSAVACYCCTTETRCSRRRQTLFPVPPPGKPDRTYVVFDSDIFVPLCDVIHKPEAHNILHYRQRRTEPRPQVTCTEN